MGHDEILDRIDEATGIRVMSPTLHRACCCLLQFIKAAKAQQLGDIKAHLIPRHICPRCMYDEGYEYIQLPDVQFYLHAEIKGNETFNDEKDIFKNDLNKRYKYYANVILRNAEKYFLENMNRNMFDRHSHLEVEFEL